MSRELVGVLPGTGRIRVTVEHRRIDAVEVLDRGVTDDGYLTDDEVLLPGLVDLQVNGYAGVDFNDPGFGPDDVRAVVERLWAVGVTSFCPTLITGPADRMVDALRSITTARRKDDDVDQAVLGAHLEGPWISPLDGARGAHPREHVRAPDVRELHRLTDAADVAILTVAPEAVGAQELIEAAVRGGTVVSVGHCFAAPEDVRMAAAAGATLSTHLGNGVPSMLPRHPNLIWEQLAERRLTGMFIADGHHLDLSTLTAMVRAKGRGGWLLVSDVTAIGGMPVGQYRTPVGGLVELDETGRLGMVGTGYLAGAARSLLDGLCWLLGSGTVPADDVVAAVSAVPLQVIGPRAGNRIDARADDGVADGTGIVAGRRADLVRARWTPDQGALRVLETLSGGRTVWRAGS